MVVIVNRPCDLLMRFAGVGCFIVMMMATMTAMICNGSLVVDRFVGAARRVARCNVQPRWSMAKSGDATECAKDGWSITRSHGQMTQRGCGLKVVRPRTCMYPIRSSLTMISSSGSSGFSNRCQSFGATAPIFLHE